MNNLPVHVLADASIAVKLGEASCGEVRESNEVARVQLRDSRGGQNVFVAYGCATNGRGKRQEFLCCSLLPSPPTNLFC